MKTQAIERRYALTSLGRGTGKYLLISNDRHHAYVVARYEEDGTLSQVQSDGSTRAIIGTFWRTLYVQPDSGLVSYVGTPGKSHVDGVPDPERLLNAAIDLAPSLVEVEGLLRSREEAVQVALRRYVARQHRTGQHHFWGVYDRVTGSWPSLVAGRRVADMAQDPAAAEADADWLNRHHA